MALITKELIKKRNDHDVNETIDKLFDKFRGSISHAHYNIASYLLCKASLKKDVDPTYNNIINGTFDIPEELIIPITNSFTEEMWNEISDLTKEFSKEIFALATFTNEKHVNYGRPMDETTPLAIVSLANEVLKLEETDTIADFCSGYGTFTNYAAVHHPACSYTCYELSLESTLIASLCADLINADITINTRDVFSLSGENNGFKYDKIFCNYPFGEKINRNKNSEHYFEELREKCPEVSRTTSSDWIYNALLCEHLSETGKAVALMTNGSTWNRIDMPMRKLFLENGMVEAVITLPERMFTRTGISTTMIVFSYDNESVKIVDATNICPAGRRFTEFTEDDIKRILIALDKDTDISKTVTIDELRANDYALNLTRYMNIDVHFDNGVPFNDVITSITRGSHCKASELDKLVSHTPTNMQYLMLANIKNGVIDENLPFLSAIDEKDEKYCLEDKDLILSKNGYPYKIAVANVKEGRKILANGNLFIIKLNKEKVNPYYIKAFFESEIGNTLLKSITVGTVLPNIGVAGLKELTIPLPPLEEQNRIADKYQAKLDEISILKLRLEKAEEQLHHIFEEESEV